MHCDLEYEEADAQTGRNLRTTALSAMVRKINQYFVLYTNNITCN